MNRLNTSFGQLLHPNIEKMLRLSTDLFRYLQMGFWKPSAVRGWAGFSQPSDWEEVAVTGLTVHSYTKLLLSGERTERQLQRMEMIVPKVANIELATDTHTSSPTRTHTYHKSLSAHTDAGQMKHVSLVLPLTDNKV